MIYRSELVTQHQFYLLKFPISPPEDDAAIDDPFQWNADEHSESTSVRLLHDINSSISDALVPVLHLLKSRMRFYENRPGVFDTAKNNITKNLDPRLAGPLVHELYAARKAQSRFLFGDEVVEALLQDTICKTLYQSFFAGKIFFGIQHNHDQKSALDTIFEHLLKKGTTIINIKILGLVCSIKV